MRHTFPNTHIVLLCMPSTGILRKAGGRPKHQKECAWNKQQCRGCVCEVVTCFLDHRLPKSDLRGRHLEHFVCCIHFLVFLLLPYVRCRRMWWKRIDLRGQSTACSRKGERTYYSISVKSILLHCTRRVVECLYFWDTVACVTVGFCCKRIPRVALFIGVHCSWNQSRTSPRKCWYLCVGWRAHMREEGAWQHAFVRQSDTSWDTTSAKYRGCIIVLEFFFIKMFQAQYDFCLSTYRTWHKKTHLNDDIFVKIKFYQGFNLQRVCCVLSGVPCVEVRFTGPSYTDRDNIGV